MMGIIISLSFVLMFAYVYLFSSSKLYKVLFFILTICAIITGFFPQLSTTVAQFLGIGRGVDFSFILLFILILHLINLNILKTSKIESQITLLVRNLAIFNAIKPKK